MTTEKEKIMEKAGCKKCKYKKTCNGSCALYRLYENGFEPDLFKAGKSEAISNFAEKIYEFIGLERYYDAQAHQKVIESEKLIEFMKNLYNKLVEEQTSSGETK